MRRPFRSLPTPVLALAAVAALGADLVFGGSVAISDDLIAELDLEGLPAFDELALTEVADQGSHPIYDGIESTVHQTSGAWVLTLTNTHAESRRLAFAVHSYVTAGSAMGRMGPMPEELAVQDVRLGLEGHASVDVPLRIRLPKKPARVDESWFRTLTFDLVSADASEERLALVRVEETRPAYLEDINGLGERQVLAAESAATIPSSSQLLAILGTGGLD